METPLICDRARWLAGEEGPGAHRVTVGEESRGERAPLQYRTVAPSFVIPVRVEIAVRRQCRRPRRSNSVTFTEHRAFVGEFGSGVGTCRVSRPVFMILRNVTCQSETF
jgi:hypothetical protein